MPCYQTFPGQTGDSNSFAKLASIAMPSLNGKSFLDIGCNEGFFCGFAFFEGARSVTGVDNNAEFLRKAEKRFPQCRFELKDWFDYLAKTDKKFDVILCTSAIHYAHDQEALVAAMVEHLSPNGLLILEMGIANALTPGAIETSRPGWLKCKRDIDERLFPTWGGLEEMLSPYAWKYFGESVPQKGDAVPRFIFHVRRALPYAVFLCGSSSSGKTTAARRLLGNIARVDGDRIWATAAKMEGKYPKLAALAKTSTSWGMLDKLATKMFLDGSWEEYAAIVADQGAGNDFVFDGYIPPDWQARFMERLEKYGYRVLKMEMPPISHPPAEMLAQNRLETRKYNMFLEACTRQFRNV